MRNPEHQFQVVPRDWRELKRRNIVMQKTDYSCGAAALATGHYVASRRLPDGRRALYRAADPERDQSYFLYATTAEQLDLLRFPLGERGKDGRYTVTVLDAANKQTPRQVKIGLQDGAKVQVIDGLKAGEKVLLAPPSAPDAAASAASAASS